MRKCCKFAMTIRPNNDFIKINYIPVSTRRRFNVVSTSERRRVVTGTSIIHLNLRLLANGLDWSNNQFALKNIQSSYVDMMTSSCLLKGFRFSSATTICGGVFGVLFVLNRLFPWEVTGIPDCIGPLTVDSISRTLSLVIGCSIEASLFGALIAVVVCTWLKRVSDALCFTGGGGCCCCCCVWCCCICCEDSWCCCCNGWWGILGEFL